MDQLLATVRRYSDSIQNNRTIEDIHEYLLDEVMELDDEMESGGAGADGIAGEAIDVILCALDLIYKSAPQMTDDDIVEYARRKCEKWANKYGGG